MKLNFDGPRGPGEMVSVPPGQREEPHNDQLCGSLLS